MTAEWWHCTREEYDADTEFIRSTALKDFHDCPSIYRARHILPPNHFRYMEPKKLGREAVLGTCVHAGVLEDREDWVSAENCQAELKSGDRKGQECGKSTSNGGFDHSSGKWLCGTHGKGLHVSFPETALTPDEETRVRGMIRAVRESKVAQDILADRFHERACRSVDPETGVKKKALIDIIKPRPFMLVDLKTTGEFNPESIWRKVDENCWGLSLAHYESVVQDIQAAKGKPVHFPIWMALVVESVKPFRVKDWPLDDIADDSRREYRQLLSEFAECQRTGVWPEKDINTAVPQWYGYRHGMMNQGSL